MHTIHALAKSARTEEMKLRSLSSRVRESTETLQLSYPQVQCNI